MEQQQPVGWENVAGIKLAELARLAQFGDAVLGTMMAEGIDAGDRLAHIVRHAAHYGLGHENVGADADTDPWIVGSCPDDEQEREALAESDREEPRS